MNRLLGILLLTACCFSACRQKETDIIADIRKKSLEINKQLKDYSSRRVDDLTTLAHGSVTGYYREEELKKMSAEHFKVTGRDFSEYYFDDGMLILIVKQDYSYNRPTTYTEEKARENNDSEWYDDKKTKLDINKFYFYKNKLIRWTGDSNDSLPVSTANFTDKEAELWSESLILMKQLKEQ